MMIAEKWRVASFDKTYVITDGLSAGDVMLLPDDYIIPPLDMIDCNTEEEARLVAAAPELLEIARCVLAEDLIQHLPVEFVKRIERLISSVEG